MTTEVEEASAEELVALLSDDMLAAGITYRQLDHWCSKGYLRPDAASPGSGFRRTFPKVELVIARLMLLLVDAGLEPKAAARAAREGMENGLPFGLLNDQVAVVWRPCTGGEGSAA